MNIRPEIYEKLTPRQRVIATVEACARDDETEVTRLVKSCPKKTYKQADAAFSETMESLVNLALAVELDLRGQALNWTMAVIADQADDDLTAVVIQNTINIKAAWDELLKDRGIEPETMEKMCRTLRHPVSWMLGNVIKDKAGYSLQPQADVVAGYKADFEQVMRGQNHG